MKIRSIMNLIGVTFLAVTLLSITSLADVTILDNRVHLEEDTANGFIYPVNISFNVPTDQELGKFALFIPIDNSDNWGYSTDADRFGLYKAMETEAVDGVVSFPTFYSDYEYNNLMNPTDNFIRPVVAQLGTDGSPAWTRFFSDYWVPEISDGIYIRNFSLDEWTSKGVEILYVYDDGLTPIVVSWGEYSNLRNHTWKKDLDITATITSENDIPTGKFKLYDENNELIGEATVDDNNEVKWTVSETWEEVNEMGYHTGLNTMTGNISDGTTSIPNEKTKTYKIVQSDGNDSSIVYDKTETEVTVSMHYEWVDGYMVLQCEATSPSLTVNNTKLTGTAEITKEVPAGTYGIYNSDRELITEIESDDDNIITTVLNVVKNISNTVIYYIKQLTIKDDTLNIDNKYKQFKVVATLSELGTTLDTTVQGLDEIEFNNTLKKSTPSEIDDVATGSEIPKNTDKATGSEIPKTDKEDIPKDNNINKNHGDNGFNPNLPDFDDVISDEGKKYLEDKAIEEDRKRAEREDNAPAFDGDWIDIESNNFNSSDSKAGGARFKMTNGVMIKNEKRILPVHGRSGVYKTYLFDYEGNLVYGWAKDPKTHNWHYFGEDGAEVYRWQFINGKWYFFLDDMDSIYRGEMLSNCIIDGLHLGADGALIENVIPTEVIK